MVFALAGCMAPTDAPLPTCTVQGIDVWRHQGDIDWPKVADAGIRFAWIKATEGGDYLDPAFRRNWLLAQAAGIKRGAYHFVYWCRPAAQQAAWLVANVPDDPDALPPVLDVEWNPGSRTCPGKPARAAALAQIHRLFADMTRNYRQTPLVYAPADLYAEVLRDALPGAPLWVRSLHGPPPTLYGDRGWQIWQYSETGRIPGIRGPVDRDCVEAARAGRVLGLPTQRP